MTLELIGLLLVVCLGIIAGYVRRIHLDHERLLAFLDTQDIDRRTARATDRRSGDVRFKAIESFFRDTRGILGKLFSFAEGMNPHQPDTVATPSPRAAILPRGPVPDAAPTARMDASRADVPPDRVSDSDLVTQCFEGPVRIPSAISDLGASSAPPPSASHARAQGVARVHELAAGLGRPASAQPSGRRGTLASAVGLAPTSSRLAPPVLTRRKCSACERGIVQYLGGELGRCPVCGGSGELDVSAGPYADPSSSAASPPGAA